MLHSCLRVFALVCAKILVYFSKNAIFSIQLLTRAHTHTHQIIYSILYFIKILIFSFFLIVFFFTHNNYYPLYSFILRCKMSNVNVNLHSHCINFANFHIFNLINVNNFETYKYIKLSIFFLIFLILY